MCLCMCRARWWPAPCPYVLWVQTAPSPVMVVERSPSRTCAPAPLPLLQPRDRRQALGPIQGPTCAWQSECHRQRRRCLLLLCAGTSHCAQPLGSMGTTEVDTGLQSVCRHLACTTLPFPSPPSPRIHLPLLAFWLCVTHGPNRPCHPAGPPARCSLPSPCAAWTTASSSTPRFACGWSATPTSTCQNPSASPVSAHLGCSVLCRDFGLSSVVLELAVLCRAMAAAVEGSSAPSNLIDNPLLCRNLLCNCDAVTDSGSHRVIPPIDPANPDPLNTVNTTVISVPNARAEGELGCTRIGCASRHSLPQSLSADSPWRAAACRPVSMPPTCDSPALTDALSPLLFLPLQSCWLTCRWPTLCRPSASPRGSCRSHLTWRRSGEFIS